MLKSVGILGLALSLVGVAFGAGFPVSTGSVEVGKWNSNFGACLDYAKDNHVPLLVFLAASGCTFCDKLEASVAESDYFSQWQAQRDVVLCFVYIDGARTPDQVNADNFTCGYYVDEWGPHCRQGARPQMALYWVPPGQDASQVEPRLFPGRDNEMLVSTNGIPDYALACQLADSADLYFADWFFPCESEFEVGTTPAARLEAVAGKTTFVDVPVRRTNALYRVDENYLVSSWRGMSATNAIAWGAGVSRQVVRVAIPSEAAAGETIALSLLNSRRKTVVGSSIAMVVEPENNPKNPLWIGERTAESLKWGEWTMDLDVARSKVAAGPQDACTLILVGGSTWCPDCVKVDHYLVDTPEFKAWANERKLACVAIDVPKMGSTEPSLLTYGTCAVSSRYITSTVPNQEPLQSGAGYLSRKMAEPAEALRISERNHTLLYNDTAHGGLCRPENCDAGNEQTGQFRTGIPCLIVMRRDGTIAGRIYQFNNVSPSRFESGYLRRLDEILAQAKDVNEEANDHYSTTAAVLRPGATERATLGPCDAADVWKVPLSGGTVEVTVAKGAEGVDLNSAVVKLEQMRGGKLTTISSAVGRLSDGLRVGGPVEGGEVYLTLDVGGSYDEGPDKPLKMYLPADDRAMTCQYALTVTAVAVPTETTAVHEYDEAAETATIVVENGKKYWIEGLGTLSGTEGLVLESGNVYRATKTGKAVVPLAAAVGSSKVVRYRTWTGGWIGFEEPEATVSEFCDGKASKTIPVRLVRGDGESGEVTASVSLRMNEAVRRALDDGRFAWTDSTVSWKNGESSVRSLPLVIFDDFICDGDLELVFDVSIVSSTEGTGVRVAGERGTEKLTILQDDGEDRGVLAFVSGTPAFCSDRQMVVTAGSSVSLTVARERGATGAVSARLVLKAGAAELMRSSPLSWGDRSRQNLQSGRLTVPSDRAGSILTVELEPTNVQTDPCRNVIRIQVVSADAPRFDESLVSLSGYGTVGCSREVGVSGFKAGDELFVRQMSGALPPGLTAVLSENRLVLSGAPETAGDYAVSYEICAVRNGVVELGTTVRLEASVADLDIGAKIPSLATTRTYRDVPVCLDGRLKGLLTVTVPASGKCSAKYRTMRATVSFATGCWSDYDGGTAVKATLDGVSSESTASLELTVRAVGGVTARFEDPDDGERIELDLPELVFDAANRADEWKGRYAVHLMQTNGVSPAAEGLAHLTGGAFAMLEMSESAAESGTMVYAGVLPNGTAFSGASVLSLTDGPAAEMPIMGRSDFVLSPCEWAGLLTVLPNGAEAHLGSDPWLVGGSSRAVPYWVVCDAVGRVSDFTAYGTWYDPDEILGAFKYNYTDADGDLERVGFGANAGGSLEASSFWGFLTTAPAFVDVVVGERSVQLSPDAANPDRVYLTFDPDTGVIQGNLRLHFQAAPELAATYRGLVIPAWVGCETCKGQVPRPFAAGSCWFVDKNESGAYRNGCDVTIGLNQEEP